MLFKGKSVSTPIVEVISHFNEDVKEQRKLAGERIFEGIRLREDGYIKTAYNHFSALKQDFPQDRAVIHHFNICQKAVDDKSWDGLVRL